MRSRKRQTGLTLLELIFALAAVGFMTLLTMQERDTDRDQDKARVTGGQLYQINNAIREWVAANIGAPSQTLTGTAWLKSTSCAGGTGTINYLPCNFPDGTTTNPLPYGRLAITSNVVTTGVAPNQVTKVTTTTSPYIIKAGVVRADLAGLAAVIAAAGSQTAASQGATDSTYNSNMTSGVITLTTGNGGSTDAWIRTDSSNTMNASLRFNSGLPAAQREIWYTSRLQNIAANALTLGNPSGGALGYGVVVDANQSVQGALAIQNVTNAANGLNIQRGDLRTLGGGSISATGQATAGNRFYSPNYVDLNNGGYYIDPNGQSVLNRLDANTAVFAPYLADTEGGGFVLDLNGSTSLNYSTQNTLTTYGDYNVVFHGTHKNRIQFMGRQQESTWCSPLGAIGVMQGSGRIGACVATPYGWLWKGTITSRTPTVYRIDRPTGTPAGQTVINIPGLPDLCVVTGQFSSKMTDTNCAVNASFTGYTFTYIVPTTTPVNMWCEAMCI